METCYQGHKWLKEKHRQCPACQSEGRKRRYQERRDIELRQNREWIERNREQYRDTRKKYVEENKEQVEQWYKEWCEANPLHSIYRNMLRRCFNPESDSYKNYGGRGVTVSARWLGDDGYKNFESDMPPRPSPDHTIDRIKTEGNYEPGNVKWSNRSEQQRNRRVNRLVTIGGRTQCLAAWCEESGIGFKTLQKRINNRWPEHKLLEPPDQRHRTIGNTGRKKRKLVP